MLVDATAITTAIAAAIAATIAVTIAAAIMPSLSWLLLLALHHSINIIHIIGTNVVWEVVMLQRMTNKKDCKREIDNDHLWNEEDGINSGDCHQWQWIL